MFYGEVILMNKKSRFKSFLLSMLPGVGHMYLGFTSRGFIFLGTTLAVIFILQFMQPMHYNSGLFSFQFLRGYRNILEFIIPLVWLSSVIDNFILTIKYNKGAFLVEPDSSLQASSLDRVLHAQNKVLLSVMLNIIPGAGHVFLGFKDKGLQIAGSFFSVYLAGQFVGFDIFNFIAGLIWIYSILDVINISSRSLDELVNTRLSFEDFNKAVFFFKSKLHWIGSLLVLVGIMVLVNRLSLEFIDKNILRQIEGYIKDAFVSVLCIGLGIKLLAGKKKNLVKAGGVE
jgi:hypothetical protein